jgi:invasion protein IalB
MDAGYEEIPARRSRLVPILTIVAALLAVAIAVVVVLYALGVFDSTPGPSNTVSTDTQAPINLSPDNVPAPPDVREVGVNQLPADATAPAADAVAPDVRDAAVSIAPPAQGEPPVRSTHGDWQVRCDTPAGAQNEQCVLMQFVTAEDRDNVGLTVIVLKTADGQSRIMRILAPLGVLLPSGLGLKIDDADIGRAGFVRCLPNGCVAEVILEQDLLDKLNKGKTATFIIFQTPEEGIGIPISLAGFGAGFQALP